VKYGILILFVAALCTGCSTGPVQAKPDPPSTNWYLLDWNLSGTPQQGNGPEFTLFINPGDQYMVIFQATSLNGIKNITLSGTGDVHCNDGSLPAPPTPPTFTIPPVVINLPLQPNQQAFTQALNPYSFIWSKIPATPTNAEIDGPALTEFNQCNAKSPTLVPLLGTTTYTGQATSYSGMASSSTLMHVTTCPGGVQLADFSCAPPLCPGPACPHH
jgi:hypothetical protein